MKSTNLIMLFAGVMFFSACNNRKSSYDATGTFEATEIIVSSEASGKIMQFDIEEGQLLEPGKTLGYIDSTQLYLRKLQLQASAKSVISRRPETGKQIAALQQQITTAIREQQRIENLLSSNAANQKQLDDAVAMIALLEKQLEALKSTLSITNKGISEESSVIEIQVAQLNDQLLKCKITSPIKGTVLSKYTEAGELTTQGKSLFKVADTEQMILRAYITAGQLSQIKIGQEVKIFADYGNTDSREYAGIITWISDKSEFTPKTIQTRDERANLVYAIKVAVKNDGLLKIGMYGNVMLNT